MFWVCYPSGLSIQTVWVRTLPVGNMGWLNSLCSEFVICLVWAYKQSEYGPSLLETWGDLTLYVLSLLSVWSEHTHSMGTDPPCWKHGVAYTCLVLCGNVLWCSMCYGRKMCQMYITYPYKLLVLLVWFVTFNNCESCLVHSKIELRSVTQINIPTWGRFTNVLACLFCFILFVLTFGL